MQNTIRTAFAAALLAAASLGVSFTSLAARPGASAGASGGSGVVKVELGSLRRSDKVVVDVGMTVVDSNAVLDIIAAYDAEHGRTGLDTNAVIDLVREYGDSGLDTNAVIDLVREYGDSGLDTNAVLDIIAAYDAEHGRTGLDTNVVEDLIAINDRTNTSVRIGALESELSGLDTKFLPQSAVLRGFTDWEVIPAAPIHTNIVVGSLSPPSAIAITERWAIFYADDPVKNNSTRISNVKIVPYASTNVSWSASETALGVGVYAKRICVPTFRDIVDLRDGVWSTWNDLYNAMVIVDYRTTNNYDLAVAANRRAKNLEFWQYTNSVTRSDVRRGMTDWAVTPTWPVGRVTVGTLSSGAGAGLWSLFRPESEVHSAATALVYPVPGVPDRFGDVTGLRWTNVSWTVDASFTNDLDTLGIPWGNLSVDGTSAVVTARLDIDASRVRLVTMDDIEAASGRPGGSVSFSLPARFFPVSYGCSDGVFSIEDQAGVSFSSPDSGGGMVVMSDVAGGRKVCLFDPRTLKFSGEAAGVDTGSLVFGGVHAVSNLAPAVDIRLDGVQLVPAGRTVNGMALDSDVVLKASDVGVSSRSESDGSGRHIVIDGTDIGIPDQLPVSYSGGVMHASPAFSITTDDADRAAFRDAVAHVWLSAFDGDDSLDGMSPDRAVRTIAGAYKAAYCAVTNGYISATGRVVVAVAEGVYAPAEIASSLSGGIVFAATGDRCDTVLDGSLGAGRVSSGTVSDTPMRCSGGFPFVMEGWTVTRFDRSLQAGYGYRNRQYAMTDGVTFRRCEITGNHSKVFMPWLAGEFEECDIHGNKPGRAMQGAVPVAAFGGPGSTNQYARLVRCHVWDNDFSVFQYLIYGEDSFAEHCLFEVDFYEQYVSASSPSDGPGGGSNTIIAGSYSNPAVSGGRHGAYAGFNSGSFIVVASPGAGYDDSIYSTGMSCVVRSAVLTPDFVAAYPDCPSVRGNGLPDYGYRDSGLSGAVAAGRLPKVLDSANKYTDTEISKLPRPDYSTENTQLVATIEAKAPRPDYSTSNTQLVETIQAKAPRPDYSVTNETLVATIEAKAPRPDYSSEEFAQAVEAVSLPVVHLEGDETVGGVKTFGSEGVVVHDAQTGFSMKLLGTGIAVTHGSHTAYFYVPDIEQGGGTFALLTDVMGKADKPATFTGGNIVSFGQFGSLEDSGLSVESFLFPQYYPDGSVKSAAEFTRGIKYDAPDTTNRTITVKPFCNTGTAANDNSALVGRVVIPPFVDAQGNGYISDDGTRFKVVGVSGSDWSDPTTNLTAIVAPNTVTNIVPNAFQLCTALTTGSFPSVTVVGVAAFSYCCSLDSISFPSATTIGPSAFYGCTSLASVDFGDTPRSDVPSLGKSAFVGVGVPTSCKIIVPDLQYDDWTAASGWSELVARGYKFLRHSEWEYARRYELQAAANAAQTAAVSAANAYTTASISKTNSVFVEAVQASVTAPDYSTANTQLVETIQATAPPPGNYAVVSNRAINAVTTNSLGSVTLSQVEYRNAANYDALTVENRMYENDVITHNGDYYIVGQTFQKTALGWSNDVVAGKIRKPGAEGERCVTIGNYTSTAGTGDAAAGQYSFAEGDYTHAEGYSTHAEGSYTHAEGMFTHAEGTATHAEGNNTHAEGYSTHAEGNNTHAEGYSTHAEGDSTHAEGASTHAEGGYTHAEGTATYAEGSYTHAEGGNTHASGYNTHSEGYYTHAAGNYTHAEGNSTYAGGNATHSEGESTHAEGYNTHAEGAATHAEGYYTHAAGDYTHAEGSCTHAEGAATHAEGVRSAATNNTAFVWQGAAGEPYSDYNPETYPQYGSHGDGTYNINPAPAAGETDVASGFYIGERSLKSRMDDKMEISAIAEALKHIKTGDYEDMDAIADRLDALIRALKGIYIPDDYEIEGDTLYFRGLEAGSTVSMVHSADAVEASAMDASESPALSVDLEYSMGDSGVWAPFLTTGTPTVVTLKKGEWVRIRAPEGVTNETFTTSDWEDIVHFTSSGRVEVGGNLMSLFYHDAAGATVFPTTNACAAAALFGECAGLVDASKLELPTISVEDRCYEYMFGGCTNLVSPPAVLPATNLSWSCYSAMFQDCTALTNAPALPATALAVGCYDVMFDGCASLVAAPELPATNLEAYCYSYMFGGCTALASAPTLPATALAASCYSGMFDGCTAMTNAPALPATVLATSCYESMFHGCTSLVAAPDLPAYAMTNRCYFAMFRGCTSLAVAPALPAETLASKCYYEMFRGCSSLSSVTADFTSLGAGGPTDNWLTGTAANGTFHGRHTLGIPQRGGSTVPAGWTVEKDRYGSTLYFDSLADGATVALHGPIPVTLEYSVDGGASWSLLKTADNDYTTVQLARGERVSIRTPAGATNTHYGADTLEDSTRFLLDHPSGLHGVLAVGGNLLALYSQEAVRNNSFPSQESCAAAYLFAGDTMLADAGDLVLPARSIYDSCCDHMFQYCILPRPPVLLATNLGPGCYRSMFEGAAMLNAPFLPAMTLAHHCYENMFSHVSSLPVPPMLPATNLAWGCYYNMFTGSSVEEAPELPATTLASDCYNSMFNGCTALARAPSLPATNLESYCYASMFAGCTLLSEAPYLPATALASECYYGMFRGCSRLSAVTTELTAFRDLDSGLPFTTDWLSGVAQSGTFTGSSALLSADRGSSTIPEGWNFVDLHPLDDSTLYFKSRADGSSVSLTPVGVGAPSVSLEYSVGGGPWAPLPTNGTAVALSTGMWMRVRAPEGVTNTAFATPLGDHVKFTVRGRIAVGGNLMSIFYHDTSAPGANEFPATPDRATFQLFAGDENGAVEDASELLLPATNLTDGCYMWMFSGCPIADAPALPATVMAESCYAYMFDTCTSLTNPPVLPAVELAPQCYMGMFGSCSSLAHAPYLPATNLVEGCYQYMFSGCEALTSLSVGFSRFDDPAATYGWLSMAGPYVGGVFRGGPGMAVPYENRSESTVPANWVVAGDGYPYDGSTMYFRALADDSAVSYNDAEGVAGPVLYSVDEGATWHDLVMDGGNNVQLDLGDVVHLRSYNANGTEHYGTAPSFASKLSGQLAVGGNPLAMTGGDLFDGVFSRMFYANDALYYAADLVMPTNYIPTSACDMMFAMNPNLTTAPALPATSLGYGCYWAMFQDCTDLVEAPALPATSLADSCYQEMFSRCTALVDPPVLPATNLAGSCYSAMFRGCARLAGFPDLPAMSLEPYCYSFMFADCFDANAPVSELRFTSGLPATNLTAGCYSGMFSGTFGLVEGPEILPAMDLAEECYGGMFYGTSLRAPPVLPATNLAARCYADMFRDCYLLGNAPALPAKVLAESCYNGMFANCGGLEEAPYLPAMSLTDTCYANMFSGCSRLSRINVGFDVFRDDLHATDYWVSGVAQEGKFGFMYTFQGSYTAGDSQVPYSWDVVEYPEAVWFSSISGTSTVALRSQGPAPGVALECSTDGVAWDQFVAGGTPVRVPEGGRLYVRAPVSCVNQTFAATNANNQLGYNKFDLSGALAVGGNLMALFCSDMDGNGYLPLTHDRAAALLFFGCTALYHAHDLRLLAQNPPPYCYQAMFSGCSNLSDGPEYLPYFGEISEGCYGGMFMGCSSLTDAPALQAETLAKGCYNYMFKGCSSLQAVTAYFLDFSSPSGEACTTGWLDGVGANGVFHCPYSLEIPSQRSGNNVPADWTVDNGY